MSRDDRLESIVIAVALTEFSAQHEQTDPELAEYAKQLADKQLVTHDPVKVSSSKRVND